MALPRNPKEARQRPRKPQAQHLTDYDIRNIDDEETLDSLLGLDEPSLDRPTNLPSAEEVMEQALAEDDDSGALPDILPGVDAPELPDLDSDYSDSSDGFDALPDLDDEGEGTENAAQATTPVHDPFADLNLGDTNDTTDGDDFDLVDLPDLDDTEVEDSADTESIMPEDVPPADFWATPPPEAPKASDVLYDVDDSDSLWGKPSDTSSAADSWEDTSDEDDDALEGIDDAVNSVSEPDDSPVDSQESNIPADIMAMLEGDGFDLSDFMDDDDESPEDEDESDSPFSGFDISAANSDVEQDTPEQESAASPIDLSVAESAADGTPSYSSGWGEVAAMFDEEEHESTDDTDSLAAFFAEHADDDDFNHNDFDLGDEFNIPDNEDEESTPPEDDAFAVPELDDPVDEDDFEVMPSLTKDDQDEDSDQDDEYDDEEEHEPLRFVMPPILSPLKAVWGAIKGGYMFIVNMFFKTLLFFLGILSKLPLVGKIFGILASMTQLLQRVAMALPLVFVVGVFALVWWFSMPGSDDVELPDMGAATVSSFDYDKSTGEVSAEIENTGEVIADVRVDFSVQSLQPTWNPKTWMIPEEVATCATRTDVEIDDTAEVSVNCGADVDGWFPRATGEISPR